METNDSIRTRLTHSHEVSNLARSIGIRLAFIHPTDIFGDDAHELRVHRTVPALLAAAGLAHDLGNPPFGHQGELSIRRWFNDYQNDTPKTPDFHKFDGNCQTFRLLTRLQILNDNYGPNLTYATLACLLKYPVCADSPPHGFRKFGLFQTERGIAEDVWRHTGLAEGVRHPLVYVLEACDDIAYSVIDAEDIVKKRYASFNDLIDHLQSVDDDPVTTDVIDLATKKSRDFRQAHLSPAELDDLTIQMFRAKAIAEMVESATDTFRANVSAMMAGSIVPIFELVRSSKCGVFCDSLKTFDYAHGYQNPSVLRLELQGNTYIRETMNLLWEGITDHLVDNPFAHYAYGRISENYRRVYEDSDKNDHDKAHLLCDAVSGMTEQFLVSVHRDLKALK